MSRAPLPQFDDEMFRCHHRCMLAQTNAELNYRAMPNAGMAAPLLTETTVSSAPPSNNKGGLEEGLMAAASQDMYR